ncbi:MAG: hypothetical protein RBT25_11660 [Lentisphaeria bacterium]|jgi:hypothetical protein|nr:hypothetical protein [Lentisphaeria bacterium]MDY0177532.1 hypothetical protein [Lentisphaeria bacterium]
MVLPLLIPAVGYVLTAVGLADAGLMLTTGKDMWQHAIGWSPYDAVFNWLGIGGGDPAPVVEAVDAAAYDWPGLIIKAGLVALVVVVGWAILRNSRRPASRRRR